MAGLSAVTSIDWPGFKSPWTVQLRFYHIKYATLSGIQTRKTVNMRGKCSDIGSHLTERKTFNLPKIMFCRNCANHWRMTHIDAIRRILARWRVFLALIEISWLCVDYSDGATCLLELHKNLTQLTSANPALANQTQVLTSYWWIN